MRPVITLTSNNEASGTTIMDDGTKVYWAKGSDIQIIKPNGAIIVIAAHHHGMLEMIRDLPAGEPIRQMTAAEEIEYAAMRKMLGG